MMRTPCAGTRRGGRPRKDPSTERVGFNHGWLMAVDGASSKILAMSPMNKPEHNKAVADMMSIITAKYSKVKTLVYDRACSFMPMAKKQKRLKAIKNYVVDRFHAHRHSRKCPCSPLKHKRLATAIKGANTSAAEQTFAWLRRYAYSFNNMHPDMHEFMLLAFSKMHNELVDSQWAPAILLANRHKARGSKAYGC